MDDKARAVVALSAVLRAIERELEIALMARDWDTIIALRAEVQRQLLGEQP